MIAESMKRIRESKDLSLYDLARLSDVAYSVLYDIENKGRDPRLSTLIKICQALNVGLDVITE